MATISTHSFANRMFSSVVGIFLLLAVLFIVFQYQRETEYRVDILDNRLQVINYQALGVALSLKDEGCGKLDDFAASNPGLRLTVFDGEGNVMYDNEKPAAKMGNHSNRKEVRQALQSGTGFDIQRNSETTGEDFFYSATLFNEKGMIIRSALPYNSQLYKDLTIDKTFIFFIIGITIVLCFILFQIAQRLATTERAKVEDEKQQLKKQLTQNAAHELKTPTASISAYLETLLNDENLNEADRRHFLERSYAQCQRMTNILSDMSALAKMDAVQQVKEPMRINAQELLEGIKADVGYALEKASMTLTVNVDDITIMGDRSLVYSIFRNLIDNAIAYAGEGKRITVSSLRISDDWAEFFVVDNGVGVPAQHLPHLCERFYRIDKGRSRKLGGTGLGLAIVKNAVVLHGGRIKLVQTHDGGLTVRFTLPVV